VLVLCRSMGCWGSSLFSFREIVMSLLLRLFRLLSAGPGSDRRVFFLGPLVPDDPVEVHIRHFCTGHVRRSPLDGVSTVTIFTIVLRQHGGRAAFTRGALHDSLDASSALCISFRQVLRLVLIFRNYLLVLAILSVGSTLHVVRRLNLTTIIFQFV